MKFLSLLIFMGFILQKSTVQSLGHSLLYSAKWKFRRYCINATEHMYRSADFEFAHKLRRYRQEQCFLDKNCMANQEFDFQVKNLEILSELSTCRCALIILSNNWKREMGREQTNFLRKPTKSFRQCRKSDPAVGKCLQGALRDAFKKMKNVGIPSLGVLPLEPLVVNDIKIDPGSDGPVTLKLHFRNLKMYGIPDSNITEYGANFNDARLTTTALTSKLWFEADYNADGKVLLLPVRGSGKCNVTLFDLKTTTDLKFHPETKNKETYWIIQSFKNKFTPKKVTVYFEGLLRGERRLNSGINQFLNDNWKVVFEELGPFFEEAFGAVFKEITHRVFSRVPVNKIFLN